MITALRFGCISDNSLLPNVSLPPREDDDDEDEDENGEFVDVA